MASRFPQESKFQLKARNGHDMKYSCDKHAEPIAFQHEKHKHISNWELVKSIEIKSFVNEPRVCGLISDDEICASVESSNSLYVTNIITERTEKVNKGGRNMYVTSCAPIDSNVIVCGKSGDCAGDSLDGCITLYDRQWEVIRDISLPRNKSSPHRDVYADVDRDGMIIAAQQGQSNIYVINPADGKIVNTITMKGKKVWGWIQTLSSGDIVVQTSLGEFTVISRSGEEKVVIHYEEWGWPTRYYIDKLTNTLYITYEDTERKVYAVDQVSCDGNIQAWRTVEYVKADHSRDMSPCLITPSGNNLVGCNGDKLFVYKKRFTV